MKLEVNITKTRFFILLAVIFLFGIGIFSYAYNSGFDKQSSDAVKFGHSTGEVIVKMNDGSLKTVQDLLNNGISGGLINYIYFSNNDVLSRGYVNWVDTPVTGKKDSSGKYIDKLVISPKSINSKIYLSFKIPFYVNKDPCNLGLFKKIGNGE